jgi:hypothetical protein
LDEDQKRAFKKVWGRFEDVRTGGWGFRRGGVGEVGQAAESVGDERELTRR